MRDLRLTSGGCAAVDLFFPTVESMVEFITERWMERWVTIDIWDEYTLMQLSRRPSFILVGVDAPVSIRWRRLKDKQVCPVQNLGLIDLTRAPM